MRDTWLGLGLLFRMSALTLGAALGSVLLGIWLDRTLGTTPMITLGLMLLGVIGGTIAMYRVVNKANQRIADHRNDSRGGK